MDLTIGSKHYHVSLLLLCVAALALAAWFARADGASAEPGLRWVATAGKYRWTVRGLTGQVATHLHHEARLEQDTAQLRHTVHLTQASLENAVLQVDSLHRALLNPVVRRVGEACGELAQNCEQRVEAAQAAFAQEHALRLLGTTRVAQADTIIGRQVAPCRFLFWRCPSRGAIAGAAFLAGVVTTVEVRR